MSPKKVLEEDFQSQISTAWEELYDAMPYYNVVKLTEGYNLLLFCIYKAAQKGEIEDLNRINTSLSENLSRMRKHIATEETERLSCKIVFNDLKALYDVARSIRERLAKTNPHYEASSLDSSDVGGLVEEYFQTVNDKLLKKLSDWVADIIIRDDVEMATAVARIIGQARRRTDDARTQPLYGYETTLAHFLLLKERMGLR